MAFSTDNIEMLAYVSAKEGNCSQNWPMQPLEENECGSLWLWVSSWLLGSGARNMNNKGKNRQSGCRCVENGHTSKDTIKIMKGQPLEKRDSWCCTYEIPFDRETAHRVGNGIWLVIPGAPLCAVMRNFCRGRNCRPGINSSPCNICIHQNPLFVTYALFSPVRRRYICSKVANVSQHSMPASRRHQGVVGAVTDFRLQLWGSCSPMSANSSKNCEVVSPRNVMGSIHKVSPTWLPKYELDKGEANGHANIHGEVPRGTQGC